MDILKDAETLISALHPYRPTHVKKVDIQAKGNNFAATLKDGIAVRFSRVGGTYDEFSMQIYIDEKAGDVIDLTANSTGELQMHLNIAYKEISRAKK